MERAPGSPEQTSDVTMRRAWLWMMGAREVRGEVDVSGVRGMDTEGVEVKLP